MHAVTYTGLDESAIRAQIAESIASALGCTKEKALDQPQVLIVEPEKNKILRKQILSVINDLSLSTVAKQQRWVLIFRADTMNSEAANALLKLLEEPPARTHFVLTAPSAANLLPTIRSRTAIVSVSPSKHEVGVSDLFASRTLGSRMAIIAKHSDKKTLDDAFKGLLATLHYEKRYSDLAWLKQYDVYVKNVPNYRLLLEAWAVYCAAEEQAS